MTAKRDQLLRSVAELPEDGVTATLAFVARITQRVDPGRWPPDWFGAIRAIGSEGTPPAGPTTHGAS